MESLSDDGYNIAAAKALTEGIYEATLEMFLGSAISSVFVFSLPASLSVSLVIVPAISKASEIISLDRPSSAYQTEAWLCFSSRSMSLYSFAYFLSSKYPKPLT